MAIAVVGAGIIGISSAYYIKKRYPHLEVIVISKKFSPHTTSDGAAGLWKPYLPGETSISLLKRWSKETYDYVIDLIRNDPTSGLAGLYTRHGYHLSVNETTEDFFWSDIPYDFKRLTKDDLKRFPDCIRSGISFTTVFIEGSKYIPWLSKKFIDLGGKFVQKEVKSLQELSAQFEIIVNCAGLGARELVNDERVIPIRGQIARVKAPWVTQFVNTDISNEKRNAYILPNQDYVVLGGTAYSNDFNTEVDANDTEWIMSACQEFCPSLKYAEHLGDWVGLRPSRDAMRVEKEDLKVNENGTEKIVKVVHNYGHGGCGLTVHRGCASDVAELVTQCIAELSPLKSKL